MYKHVAICKMFKQQTVSYLLHCCDCVFNIFNWLTDGQSDEAHTTDNQCHTAAQLHSLI